MYYVCLNRKKTHITGVSDFVFFHRFACRTVIQKHSMLLAFHLGTKILLEEGKLDKAEYEFFIKGAQVFLTQLCFFILEQIIYKLLFRIK